MSKIFGFCGGADLLRMRYDSQSGNRFRFCSPVYWFNYDYRWDRLTERELLGIFPGADEYALLS